MSTHLLGSLEDGEHVQAKQHASTPAREHASTVQCRDPRIYCVISAGRPYVSSDLPVPVSRVSLAMS